MKCPICNAIMVNGKCPECGMMVKSGKTEPVKYDTTLKRTGRYRHPPVIEDKNTDYSHIAEKKAEDEIRDDYSEEDTATPTKRKKVNIRPPMSKKALLAVIIIICFFGFFSKISKTIHYSELGSVLNSAEDKNVKYKFDSPSELASCWGEYKQNDSIIVDSQEYEFDAILGVFTAVDSNDFIFRGTVYHPENKENYYNPEKNIYFNSSYFLLSGKPDNFITLK